EKTLVQNAQPLQESLLVYRFVPFENGPRPRAGIRSHVPASEFVAIAQMAGRLDKIKVIEPRVRQDEILFLALLFPPEHIDDDTDTEGFLIRLVAEFRHNVRGEIAVAHERAFVASDLAPQIADHGSLAFVMARRIEADHALVGNKEHLQRVDDRRFPG